MDKLPFPRKKPWRYYPLSLFAVCVAWLAAQELGAQEKRLILKEEMSVRQAIGEIERQAGVYFGYSTKLDLERIVRFDETEMELTQAVDRVIGDGFGFMQDGSYILIYPRQAVPLMFVRGRIVEGEDESPVRGAFIEIAGRKETRVRSGKNGMFEIEEIPEGYCIIKITHPETGRVIYRETAASEDNGRNRVVLFREIVVPEPPEEVQTPALLSVRPAEETHRTYHVTEPENAWVWKTGEFREFTPSIAGFSLPAPKVALKTNLLYWSLMFPNAAVEVRAARRWTVELPVIYRLDDTASKGREIFVVQPEARFWPRGVYEQFFFGLQGTWGRYRLGYLDLPFPTEADDRYIDGNMIGAGVAFGYHLPLGKRWGIEFSTALSSLTFRFDKYRSPDEERNREVRYYFGPSRVGISIQYVIR